MTRKLTKWPEDKMESFFLSRSPSSFYKITVSREVANVGDWVLGDQGRLYVSDGASVRYFDLETGNAMKKRLLEYLRRQQINNERLSKPVFLYFDIDVHDLIGVRIGFSNFKDVEVLGVVPSNVRKLTGKLIRTSVTSNTIEKLTNYGTF